MTLHILHPKSRLDRYELLVKQLQSQQITDFKLWDNKIGQSMRERRMLINSGHRKIVQYAKDNKLPKIIVAENDITFTDSGAWDYYLANEPKDYDMYFGMIYKGDIVDNRLVSESSGFTLYTIHERFYDRFLSAKQDHHIDREITAFHKDFMFKVCPKFVCYQNATQSDNTMGRPDLTRYLIGRDLFYKD
ncbi:MAG: hypothetical protein IPP56_13545 [Bacteroidetes bacterium]|jgi:hypothetical protein|nr:hypothetical protein [Bacteroidota bacterium]MBK9800683.1 hypothetical protein [Bacteroidota bacterium]MBP7108890.1 hypothetical protein [Chitinophagaceae bacterium]MBP7152158.1 hypothetical protein [Paludibacteraceae bacterium]